MSETRIPNRVRVAIANSDLQAIRALADQYFDGDGARKNRRVAFALFCIGARLGDAKLAWRAADAFEYGEGVQKSAVESERYLRIAVKLGSLGATTALGELLWRKSGSSIEKRSAVLLYRRAARLGEPHALHNLGVCYSTGDGARKNLRIAFEYFYSAAKLGHVEAQFKAGWCLLYGEGVPVNRTRAIRWLRRAAGQGSTNAVRLLKSELLKASK